MPEWGQAYADARLLMASKIIDTDCTCDEPEDIACAADLDSANSALLALVQHPDLLRRLLAEAEAAHFDEPTTPSARLEDEA